MARKTALVTGASQGIGAATALALARAGYDVAVSSTQRDKLAPLVAQLKAAGARALALELDVRQESSIAAAMHAAVSELGGLQLLVNNAGVPLRRMVVDITRAEWDQVIAVNLTGTFFMTQHMGRHLMA
ncbi:MAG TPA: SDR family NAD(P)-dependent oxidoreductase, partial [Opitutaceae bacterium]|nr:SDR family NAD(P)-dependent oxidoreductase [Opitutaceae bacterium]